MEHCTQTDTVSELYAKLTGYEPKLITNFVPTDAAEQKAAYKATMRVFRVTDEMPWFKDPAYYNGNIDMWRHLEEIRGDDIKFMFVLLGKANPANISHQRIMLETATV